MSKGLKIIALLFFMIANASIMVHAVICHHHFDDIQPVTQCNQIPCHGNVGGCSLASIYVNPCKCNQTFLQHDFDINLLPFFLFPFSDNPIFQIVDDAVLPIKQKPYLIFYHTEYIFQSLGLRAPPAC